MDVPEELMPPHRRASSATTSEPVPTDLAAAVREALEESGVRLAPGTGALVSRGSRPSGAAAVRRRFFVAACPAGEPAPTDRRGGDRSTWSCLRGRRRAGRGTLAMWPPTIGTLSSWPPSTRWRRRAPPVRVGR